MGCGIFSEKEKQKRHRKKHVNSGLCRYCSKKSVEEKTRCQYHLNKEQEHSQSLNKTKEDIE